MIIVADVFQFRSLQALVDQINKAIEETTLQPRAYNGMGVVAEGVVIAEPVNVPMSNIQVIGNNSDADFRGGGAVAPQPWGYGYAGSGGQMYALPHPGQNAMYEHQGPPGAAYPMQQPYPMQYMHPQMGHPQQQQQQPVPMGSPPGYMYTAPGAAPPPGYAEASQQPSVHAPNSNIDKNESMARQPPAYGDSTNQVRYGAVCMLYNRINIDYIS
jgi:hypothetical protein